MLGRVRWLKRLALDLPRNLKLAYCLAFDPRVPVVNKAALAAVLTAIVTPFVDIPLWIPVVGEMDVIALGLLATQLFISRAPEHVVEEQRRLIAEHHSRFDLDVARGGRLATVISHRFREPVPQGDVVGRSINTADAVDNHSGVPS
jgi:uncharacterized membrane protein YkvA (DUF1232 family)